MFDVVIFATPPDQVLKLLADPTETERRLFGPWKANFAATVIHTDLSIYDRFEVRHYTEFDVFETNNGLDAGYNAYLNRLCGISPNHPVAYNLAYNLADQINPELIVHTQHHHTPLYETGSFKTRDQIIAINGQNRTFHAGAYLGNGLHEGAITSAFTVARLLGGRTL
jgi:predicted NAD/FAD-binding protein